MLQLSKTHGGSGVSLTAATGRRVDAERSGSARRGRAGARLTPDEIGGHFRYLGWGAVPRQDGQLANAAALCLSVWRKHIACGLRSRTRDRSRTIQLSTSFMVSLFDI